MRMRALKRSASARPHSSLLRGRDFGDERLVLGLDAHHEQLHRRTAQIHAAMHDIGLDIVGLAGVKHLRLLTGTLEGEGAFDYVSDFVCIWMNMPRQHGAGSEGVALRVDLLARIAGERLNEELLRVDVARAVSLAREHKTRACRRCERQKSYDGDPHPHHITSSISSAHAFFGL